MQKILIIGYPGAGKGTQAKLLEKYNLHQISTGEVIRNSKDPRIVHYRNKGYKNGELLSDDLIFEILKKEISNLPNSAKGYLLDGAVRTLPQAKYVKNHNLIEKVIYFELSKETATKRLLNRHEGRTDDNLKAIEHRFKEFKEKTAPILSYLKENFEFYEIDAEPTVEEIHQKVLKILKL
jgi:adenylate kinase